MESKITGGRAPSRLGSRGEILRDVATDLLHRPSSPRGRRGRPTRSDSDPEPRRLGANSEAQKSLPEIVRCHAPAEAGRETSLESEAAAGAGPGASGNARAPAGRDRADGGAGGRGGRKSVSHGDLREEARSCRNKGSGSGNGGRTTSRGGIGEETEDESRGTGEGGATSMPHESGGEARGTAKKKVSLQMLRGALDSAIRRRIRSNGNLRGEK
jgi:hypothetical protein